MRAPCSRHPCASRSCPRLHKNMWQLQNRCQAKWELSFLFFFWGGVACCGPLAVCMASVFNPQAKDVFRRVGPLCKGSANAGRAFGGQDRTDLWTPTFLLPEDLHYVCGSVSLTELGGSASKSSVSMSELTVTCGRAKGWMLHLKVKVSPFEARKLGMQEALASSVQACPLASDKHWTSALRPRSAVSLLWGQCLRAFACTK